jgi:hypothetical protein
MHKWRSAAGAAPAAAAAAVLLAGAASAQAAGNGMNLHEDLHGLAITARPLGGAVSAVTGSGPAPARGDATGIALTNNDQRAAVCKFTPAPSAMGATPASTEVEPGQSAVVRVRPSYGALPLAGNLDCRPKGAPAGPTPQSK